MRIRYGKKPRVGMTLMEVVMATGILAIMAAAIIGSFNYGFLLMKLVRENQRATQVLTEKVETIRLYSWSQVNTTGFFPSSFTDYFDPRAEAGSKGVKYYGFISVSGVPFTTGYSANMREIRVTLIWFSSQGVVQVRRASSFIAKDGIQNYVY